ncbi:SCO2584 family spore wall biosynthesis protein [Streptomyces sp. SCPE 10]|uniref:SCO2584 family spore wall biosynthesis protein n=1 Tax=Streptomyces sp. SCPE 10 TaxID=3449273 RepID=UPI003F7D6A15
MPEDVGGTPFPDGWEPDDDHDRGVSDEEFASVVFDEAFVRAAVVREPSAVERLLAAAEARAEAEARRARARSERYDDTYASADLVDDADDEPDDLDDVHALDHGPFDGHGRQARWHRPVAWVLAVVIGVGMVALAFAAVYRGTSSGTRDQLPPATPTGLNQATSAPSAAPARPQVSAVPHTP